jgi:phosphatidylserine/phosphatidylglycerophosphate/cardiolipin synthase-like enzyme
LLTGSYNWTRSAARYNHENLVVTDQENLVQDFCREFDRLWQELVPLRAGQSH